MVALLPALDHHARLQLGGTLGLRLDLALRLRLQLLGDGRLRQRRRRGGLGGRNEGGGCRRGWLGGRGPEDLERSRRR